MNSDLRDRRFWTATEEEIRHGKVTDLYFAKALDVLKNSGINPRVVMEVYVRQVPYNEGWGIVTGIYEAAKLLEGLPVNVNAFQEGEVFLTSRRSAVYEPLIQIEARYADIAVFEPSLLGFLCTSTAISTKSARIKQIAGEKPVYSFGSRRAHPSLAPLIERAAYVGGFDGVSNITAAMLMGKKPVGTMPHALIQCFGNQEKAWKAFDKILGEDQKRILLVDTFYDEKTEAIMAYKMLGKRLYGIRLDTPPSRRGDMKKIVEEVRWELHIRGGQHVKIFVSGGLGEEDIRDLVDVVDGFGVGTSVSRADTIDFSAKIVEVEENGKRIFRSKRGDIAGKKQAYRNPENFQDIVTLQKLKPPGSPFKPLLTELMRNGRITRKFLDLDQMRDGILKKIRLLKTVTPSLSWRIGG